MSIEPRSRHLDEESLVLYYFGEDEGPAREAARYHLEACDRCREELEQIGEVLAMVATANPPAAPEGFERVMSARVEARLESARRRGWRAWLTVPRMAVAGGMLALLVAAFVAGRWTREPSLAPGAGTLVTLSPDTALRVATEDHLERAQMMLVEVLHADADAPALDAERARAADLVAASRLIRQSMIGAGDATTAEVLEEVERMLVEFANRADGWSPAELDAFKARLEEGGILFRLRVLSAEVGARRQRRPPVT